MADLMEIARRTRDRTRKESKQSKESPPPAEGPDPFACFPCLSSGPVQWNSEEASRLMSDADTLVERLGANGTNPEVRAVAALVASAYATRDVETLRFACAEFQAAVRRLSAGPGGCRVW